MKCILVSIICCLGAIICNGQSQAEMTLNAKNSFQQSETEINVVYQTIVKQYSADVIFIKNLRAAQRLWIQFRDAEMKAKFPVKTPGYYGSTQSMCWYNDMAGLTNERIQKLKTWVDGSVEGDVCSGSIKKKK